jgi:non-heme chloroperoxidase
MLSRGIERENTMPYIKVDKENSAHVKLYYEDHGSGQPVVLIHGFPMDGSAWEKQKLALLQAGYRTITFDRRGFGRSDQPAIGYNFDTFARDLAKVIDELDLRDVVLMGHSMGTGEIVRYLATRGSKRVARAVLISPLQPFMLKTADNPEGVDKNVFDGIQQAIVEDRPAYLTQFFQDFYNLDENLGNRVSRQVVDANWNVAVSASPKGTHDCVDTFQTDFRADLPNIDVPTLIIHGLDDRILPFESTAARLPTLIKDSGLLAIDGGPHGLPWAYADEVNEAVLTFLGQEAGEKQKARTWQSEPAFGETLEGERLESERLESEE